MFQSVRVTQSPHTVEPSRRSHPMRSPNGLHGRISGMADLYPAASRALIDGGRPVTADAGEAHGGAVIDVVPAKERAAGGDRGLVR